MASRNRKVPLSITECIDADQELREFMSDMGYILCDLGHIPDDELASDAEVCAGLLPLKHVYRGTDPEVLLASDIASADRRDSIWKNR